MTHSTCYKHLNLEFDLIKEDSLRKCCWSRVLKDEALSKSREGKYWSMSKDLWRKEYCHM